MKKYFTYYLFMELETDWNCFDDEWNLVWVLIPDDDFQRDEVWFQVQNILLADYFWKKIEELDNWDVEFWVWKFSEKFREIWNKDVESSLDNWDNVVKISSLKEKIYKKSAWVAINHELGEELALAA